MNGSAAILVMILEELRSINRKLDVMIGPNGYTSLENIYDKLFDIDITTKGIDGENACSTLNDIATTLEDIKGIGVMGSLSEIYEKICDMECELDSIDSKMP